MSKNQVETNVVKPKLSVFNQEIEYRLISTEVEEQLDSKIDDVENFMKNNIGLGTSDENKDKLYTDAKVLWNNYAGVLRDVEYTFFLNRKQYQFLTGLLLEKLEYDVNTIFLAIELTNMLGNWKDGGKHKDDEDFKGFTSDATEVTYMYHLIAKHKVKGLTKDAYLFAEVLKKIGDISKIINYYDTSAKNMSKEIQEWVASFEPEVDPNVPQVTEESIAAIKVKAAPKKKKDPVE
jgi:hypothetical protein